MTQALIDVIFESAPTEASEEEQLAWCEEQMTELCGALENERENSQRLEDQLRHERAEISKLRAALAATSIDVEELPQPPVPQQRALLQQPSQMLLRIPLVPNRVACQNTNPLPAVYAF